MTSNPAQFLRRFAALFAALCCAALFAAPTNVLIRVPPGTPSPSGLAELLAKWRQSGQVANALMLTEGRGEKPGDQPVFETLVVLEFPSEHSAEIWQREAAPLGPRW